MTDSVLVQPNSAMEPRSPLPTIWEVSDPMWENVFLPLLKEFDPPPRMGRPRADQRKCLDGMIYRARTGCQWNQLPEKFGSDSTVHRTIRRWDDKSIFDKLWALLIYHCEDLKDVHWEWQSVDGCLHKARFIGDGTKGGIKRTSQMCVVPRPRKPRNQGTVSVRTRVTEAKWASRRASLLRQEADRYLSASPERM